MDLRARQRKHYWIQGGGYLLGLLLYFGPFAVLIPAAYALAGKASAGGGCDTHFRVEIASLLRADGWTKLLQRDPNALTMVGFLSALLTVAFLFGPLFCGRACPAGALPSYLSRLVPRRWQFDFRGKVNATAIRYGFLSGFVVLPLLGQTYKQFGGLACTFCNFRLMDYLVVGATGGFVPALSSTYILVLLFWLVAGGLFTGGGRGWCAFFCPAGAVQGLAHSLGARLGWTFKIRYNPARCTSCRTCVGVCTMRAISPAAAGQWKTQRGDGVLLDRHACIACNDCVAACPHGALSYDIGRVEPASLNTPGVVVPDAGKVRA